ncbi:hypothetical protein N8376_00785 [Flavobacteriaceae bacterium]|nr:hypothetical protein [Flavobacteriaceae bacterium]
MNSFIANIINSLSLIFVGFWVYLNTGSIAVLITVSFGIILLLCSNGIKKENKVIAHIAVLLTLVIFIALFAITFFDTPNLEGIVLSGVIIMILTSIVSMVSFIKSFIANKKSRNK